MDKCAVTVIVRASACWFTCLLASCSLNVFVEVYNNSGTPLTLHGCKQSVTIRPGEAGEIGSIYSCSDLITVESAGAKWQYRLSLPSRGTGETGQDYYRSTWNGNLRVRLQVNTDRAVFVLPEGKSFPTATDIAQPSGFPWRPVPAPQANRRIDTDRFAADHAGR